MKRVSAFLVFAFICISLLLVPSFSATVPQAPPLTEASVLRIITGNPYLYGICGTVSAERLAAEFEGEVTLTSPDGRLLSGEDAVTSDTKISLGDRSVLALIYGDGDRNGRITLGDVSASLKLIAKWDAPICRAALDVTGDYSCNLTDSATILKFIAGWDGVTIGPDLTPSQITLCYYDSDCTDIGITWHTPEGSMTPVIQVRDSLGQVTEYPAEGSFSLGDRTCHGVVDSLDYGCTYSYRVGDRSGVWSSWADLTLRQETVEQFTFLCFTDTQDKSGGLSAGDNWKSALSAATASYPEAELVIHCGDVVETLGAAEWRAMLDPSAVYLRSLPTMVVSGNHETSYAGSGGYRMQYNHFYTDMPEQASVDGGYFYSFDYGPVHFVMLNTNKQGTSDDSLSPEQMAWLEADLAANDAPWTVAVMHHPLYSPGTYGADPEKNAMSLVMRAQLSSLFAEEVDLVLAGHDHVYYCTYPIDGDGTPLSDTATETVGRTVYYTCPEGAVYASPGCTGANTRDFYGSAYDSSVYRAAEASVSRTFMAITATKDTLTVNYSIPFSGKAYTVDSFGITK